VRELSLLFSWSVVAAVSAIVACIVIAFVLPWLRTHMMAPVTPRSSHFVETPEGAGVVVVPVALVAAVVALWTKGIVPPQGLSYALMVCAATLVLVIVGFVDDARGLGVVSRLIVQLICVGIVVLVLPPHMRIFPPFVPLGIERILIILGGVWFLNLFNFMDGTDLISVVETVTITLGIIILAFIDVIPPVYGWVAASLLGAVIGFAPWNAPPARVFLGDSGSTAIGFLLGVMLLQVAASASNAFAAAIILPLYYLADATITLLRRCWCRERFWRAHREHFYQKALQNGFTVIQMIRRIAVLDAGLIVLAVASTYAEKEKLWAILCFVFAATAVGLVLRIFAYGRGLSARRAG
jgi:UDP-N-acetylmuramyl pentapeptide phosphotransferase/UDP-N-acetylglucosamine-1-phosphate transferase